MLALSGKPHSEPRATTLVLSFRPNGPNTFTSSITIVYESVGVQLSMVKNVALNRSCHSKTHSTQARVIGRARLATTLA